MKSIGHDFVLEGPSGINVLCRPNCAGLGGIDTLGLLMATQLDHIIMFITSANLCRDQIPRHYQGLYYFI